LQVLRLLPFLETFPGPFPRWFWIWTADFFKDATMTERTLGWFLGLTLAIIICWLLNILKFVFLPMVIAVFISFLLEPMIQWLIRFKVPHGLAVALTMAVALLLVYLAGTIVLKSLVSFKDEFPRYEIRIQQMTTQAKKLGDLEIGPWDSAPLREFLRSFSLSSLVASTLNRVLSLTWYTFFVFIFVIYMLWGRPKLPGKIVRAFSEDRSRQIIEAFDNINQQVQRYIWAKTLTSIITGGMVIIVCLLFQVDFPITWGFFTFLLNFIPTIGVAIAAILPTLVALVQFGPWTALWLFVVLTGVLMTLGNLIEPKILGESVNLSPLVALLALIFWGWLWGAAGMVIAVPLTALIKFTFDQVPSLRWLGVMMGSEK